MVHMSVVGSRKITTRVSSRVDPVGGLVLFSRTAECVVGRVTVRTGIARIVRVEVC